MLLLLTSWKGTRIDLWDNSLIFIYLSNFLSWYWWIFKPLNQDRSIILRVVPLLHDHLDAWLTFPSLKVKIQLTLFCFLSQFLGVLIVWERICNMQNGARGGIFLLIFWCPVSVENQRRAAKCKFSPPFFRLSLFKNCKWMNSQNVFFLFHFKDLFFCFILSSSHCLIFPFQQHFSFFY